MHINLFESAAQHGLIQVRQEYQVDKAWKEATSFEVALPPNKMQLSYNRGIRFTKCNLCMALLKTSTWKEVDRF